MKKKTLSAVFAALAATCVCVGFSACGKNGNDLDLFNFTLLEDDTYSISAGKAEQPEKITIPDNYQGKPVTVIKKEGFRKCKNLKEIAIGKNITSIDDYAFSECYGLTNLIIPNNVKSIGDSAFLACNRLASLTLGEGMATIGKGAFGYCIHLTSLAIPNNVLFVGENAFHGCYKLVEIINNSSLDIQVGDKDNGEIGYYALNVKQGGASDIVNKNGYLFYASNEVNYLLGYVGSETVLSLPNGYNGENYKIYKSAFSWQDALTEIRIPDKVVGIGENAFQSCNGLTNIAIPDSITVICEETFRNCGGLTNVIIPDGLTTIGDEAFESCNKLLSITMSDNLVYIGSEAFAYCHKLVNVTIPDSVSFIGFNAFKHCIGLTNVTIGSNVSIIRSGIFVDCEQLQKVYYHGTAEEWNEISINSYNSNLTSAPRYYYSETKPTVSGNYWHYNDKHEIEEW